MTNLNIIGNGFDLYHGLPTSYYFFACYLLTEDEELYDIIANMYGFTRGITNGYTGDIDRRIENIFWSEFEKRLAYLSPDWVEGTLDDDLGLECSDAVDLEVENSNCVERIKQLLYYWVIDTIDTESNFRIVESMLKNKKMTFDPDDVFVSFNYTYTLERIYKIGKVFHIHGLAERDLWNEDTLIIGHGDSDVLDRLKQQINKLEEYDYEQSFRNRKMEYQFEKEILAELRKPVGNCLASMAVYLKDIAEPEYICLYGLSLGDVDLPYLQHIRERWKNAKWRFSYYSDEDKEKSKRVAEWLELPVKQYDLFEFNNVDSYLILDKIVSDNGITRYKCFEEE